jgi:hypothetical protein
VILTLLYINSEGVIPAPIFIGINSSRNPAQNTGFRVKPGMTSEGKEFLTHHTTFIQETLMSFE